MFTNSSDPRFRMMNGKLTTPVSQITDNKASLALHDSNVAYGTWSFDWSVGPGGINQKKAYIIVVLMWTDHQNNYYFDGITEEGEDGFLAAMSGYGLRMSSYLLSSGYEIQIIQYLESENEPPAYRFLSGGHHFFVDIGTLHIDVTRDRQGLFNVFLDSKRVFSTTDNSTISSEKFGVASWAGDSRIDNITVSNTVDIIDNTTTVATTAATTSFTAGPAVLGLMVLQAVIILRRRKKS